MTPLLLFEPHELQAAKRNTADIAAKKTIFFIPN
jgi:hypothetical protein